MLRSTFRLPRFESGTVWLVGAGPGDPGLLTLHALHALTEAEIVLHDALVSEEILSLAATARREFVGKRAGGKRTSQLRINQRLITLAHRGFRVVRLKGGDPLISAAAAKRHWRWRPRPSRSASCQASVPALAARPPRASP